MRLALMLRQREDGRIPRVAVLARRVVNRQAQVVADVRPGNALGLILVKPRRPFAGEIYADRGARRALRDERHTRDNDQRRQQPWMLHGRHSRGNASRTVGAEKAAMSVVSF